jgi:hypothetical protein
MPSRGCLGFGRRRDDLIRSRSRVGREARRHPRVQITTPRSCCPRAVRKGQLRSAAVRRGIGHRRSAGITWHSRQIPSSRSNTRASGGPRLRDGSKTGREVVGHQGAGIPSRRRRRRSKPGVGGPARSARWVLQLDPLPQACSEISSPTRRDTRFRLPALRQANTSRAR